jgi:hypothetical protein
MATGEGSERRHHQGGLLWIKGEARYPQSVHRIAHHRHRVTMAAEVEEAWPGLGGMAQPPGPDLLGGLLAQTLQPAPPLVVAADEAQGTFHQRRQRSNFLPQVCREAQAAVNQIPQHHHFPGLKLMD